MMTGRSIKAILATLSAVACVLMVSSFAPAGAVRIGATSRSYTFSVRVSDCHAGSSTIQVLEWIRTTGASTSWLGPIEISSNESARGTHGSERCSTIAPVVFPPSRCLRSAVR